MPLNIRLSLWGDPASLAWHLRVELWHLRVDNANSINTSKYTENGQNIYFFKYPSIQVSLLFYFCLKSMNKITATEYFQDYSEKYEKYEECLEEIKEVIERCEEHLWENKRRFDYKLEDLQDLNDAL